MRAIVTMSLLALCAGFCGPVDADAELVLKDGRTLRGVDVRLEAGVYLLELDSGEIAAIPAALVRELRLLDPRVSREGAVIGPPVNLSGDGVVPQTAGEKPPAPTGWRVGDAKNLAGAPWTLHDAQRQTAVLGRPSRFQESPVRFRFQPQHAWDRSRNVLARSKSTWQRPILDTVWRPRSAFDPAVDVLAASRSNWPTSPVATLWNPANSFSRMRADRWWGRDPIPLEQEPRQRTRATLDWERLIEDCGWCAGVTRQPSTFTEPRREPLTVEACARRLFADADELETLAWAEVESAAWDSLPPGLHRAWTKGGARVLFELSGETCRLIAGDLEDLLGVRLTDADAVEYAVAAWNQLRALRPHPLPDTPSGQVDFAFALAALFDAATSGHAEARLELLEDRAALERTLEPVVDCTRSVGFRFAQRAHVDRTFDRPTTEARLRATRVTFLTWLSLDGEVFAYDVTLEPGGRVGMSRKSVAQHLGEHDERP